jgi:hypothetical protein
MKRNDIIAQIEKIMAAHDNSSKEIVALKDDLKSFIEEMRPKVAESKNVTKVFVIDKAIEIPANLKVPPQMKICRDILVGLDGEELTFDEARDLFRERADELKTKQDGFRIFQYYRKGLEDAGVIRTEERAVG